MFFSRQNVASDLMSSIVCRHKYLWLLQSIFWHLLLQYQALVHCAHWKRLNKRLSQKSCKSCEEIFVTFVCVGALCLDHLVVFFFLILLCSEESLETPLICLVSNLPFFFPILPLCFWYYMWDTCPNLTLAWNSAYISIRRWNCKFPSRWRHQVSNYKVFKH